MTEIYRALQNDILTPGIVRCRVKAPYAASLHSSGRGVVHRIGRAYLYRVGDKYRIAARWACSSRFEGSKRVVLLPAPPGRSTICKRCLAAPAVLGTQMVYLAIRGDRIKIGVSQRPFDRARSLGAELLASFEGTVGDEQALHVRFAHLRVEGEWFLPGSELISFIKGLPMSSRWNTDRLPSPFALGPLRRPAEEVPA